MHKPLLKNSIFSEQILKIMKAKQKILYIINNRNSLQLTTTSTQIPNNNNKI